MYMIINNKSYYFIFALIYNFNKSILDKNLFSKFIHTYLINNYIKYYFEHIIN